MSITERQVRRGKDRRGKFAQICSIIVIIYIMLTIHAKRNYNDLHAINGLQAT
jgi:hypothetical protein